MSAEKMILGVDDDPFLRELLEAILSTPQRQIISVATGADALGRLALPPPDAVLLDLELPDISGMEVLRQLRSAATWTNVRVLMLTASHDLENIIAAKAGGAAGYVCKPVQPRKLQMMLDDLLADPSLIWLDDYTRAHKPG